MFKRTLAILSLIFALQASAFAANTYYVATTGNNSNSGAIGSPFLTVAKCYSVMSAGDTCYLRAGSYAGVPYTTTLPSGTAGNYITVAGYPGEPVTLTDAGLNMIIGPTHGEQWLAWQDLAVDGGNTVAFPISGYGNGAQTSHFLFTNIECKQGAGSCVQGSFDHTTFNHLHAHHSGGHLGTPSDDHCIYISGDDSVFVINSEFDHCTGSGIQLNHSGGQTLTNTVICNNLVHDNGFGIPNFDPGITATSGTGELICNNIVWNQQGEGINAGTVGFSDNPYVINNTIYSNTLTCIRLGGSFPTAQNNICYQNGSDSIGDSSFGATISNNLFGNPTFVDPTNHDFHIQSSSTARGYALNKTSLGFSILNSDFSSNMRPTVAAWDAGAYNFASVSPSGFVRTQPGVSCASTSSTTITCALASNPTTGNVITVHYSFYDGTATAPTITSILDGNSNSFVSESHNSGNAAVYVGQAYILSAPSNADKTITVTFSKTAIASTLFIGEYTPPSGATTFDNGGVGSGTGNIVTPTITVASTHELMVSLGETAGSLDSVNSPWTENEGGSQFAEVDASYILDRSTSAALNYSTSGGNYNSIGMSFRSCIADHLQYGTQPVGTIVGATMASFTVEIRDANNLICTTSTAPVTISRNASATWNGLTGTLTHNAVNGVATFSSISITPTIGSGTIDATSSGVTSTTSNSITITAGVSFTSTPNSCQQSQTCVLTLVGSGTNWQVGVTVCTFSGTGVPSSNATVASATSATCNAVVASNATVSLRDITVTTTPEVEVLANGLSVISIPPNNIGGGKGIGRARGRSR